MKRYSLFFLIIGCFMINSSSVISASAQKKQQQTQKFSSIKALFLGIALLSGGVVQTLAVQQPQHAHTELLKEKLFHACDKDPALLETIKGCLLGHEKPCKVTVEGIPLKLTVDKLVTMDAQELAQMEKMKKEGRSYQERQAAYKKIADKRKQQKNSR